MRFKTIYLEITNICNLSCSFCKKENRPPKMMSVDEFEEIIQKIKPYTKEIYLHVKGEPLLHKDLEALLKISNDNKIKVNITTNGTLLKEKLALIIKSPAIRQINISLHANLSNEQYLADIFESAEVILKQTNIYLNYRLWNMQSDTKIVSKINNYYNVDIRTSNIIKHNLFIEMEHVFDWPTLTGDYYCEQGKCYGLINQIAILVNGDITPCCLDSESVIKLGNIFIDNLEEVLNSERALKIIKGFKMNKKEEELCKHCNFLKIRNQTKTS